jgi:asparagine synthetase B (glutamine-hydrolysing)
LAALDGRFAILFFDADRQQVFLARDWIGEAPMHVLATAEALWIANTVSALRDSAGDGYLYAHVRSFPQACWQEIDLHEAMSGQLDLTMRPRRPETFYEFRTQVAAASEDADATDFVGLRAAVLKSVAQRVHPGRKAAMLLSGGLDSLSVALMLRAAGVDFDAFTLSIGEPEPKGDPVRAIEYARRLGVKHHLVSVEPADVIHVFDEAVRASESYHLYNVYCAVGMLLLARSLKSEGHDHAFCGEGFNEAVGDYTDWIINDPRNGRQVVLQHLNAKKLSDSEQRLALVWGPGRDHGRYNHQLGAGLAKHAASRMFKPFISYGLELEAPLLDRHFLSQIVAIDGDALKKRGGKPWLVESIFHADLREIGVSEPDVRAAPKVRLQDSSNRGRGGISPLLYGRGYDQRKVLEMFNTLFGARLPVELEVPRLKGIRHGA